MPATNIVNHSFYSEYSLQSAFLLIHLLEQFFTWCLVYPPGSLFTMVDKTKIMLVKELVDSRETEIRELQYTVFRMCIKFEHWVGIIKKKNKHDFRS